MAEDNDAISARLAAMERDVLQREAAAETKRLSLLREVAKHESDARTARSQYEDARRKSLGENTPGGGSSGSQVRLSLPLCPCRSLSLHSFLLFTATLFCAPPPRSPGRRARVFFGS